MPPTRVLLWSAPRSMSTAFERSIRELDGVKVIFQSHSMAYYNSLLGPENKFKHEDAAPWPRPPSQDTYASCDEKLLARYDNYKAVFSKNMAYVIPKERFPIYIQGKFANFKHTFLIRNPHESIPSLWKLYVKSEIFSSDTMEGSHSNLYELFEFLQSRGKISAVIDAADLKADPERVMQHYCESTGLPYNKKMLTWTPGVVEDWALLPERELWHSDAMYSSGFNSGVYTEQAKPESFPAAMHEEIQREMPHYEAMYKHRTIVL